MGGGTSRPSAGSRSRWGLSPRGRGNLGRLECHHIRGRSIPAWAGEPRALWPDARRPAVYPRVGGGTSAPSSWMTTTRGLSPRGRGNRPADRDYPPGQRSIPAWAGEPYQVPPLNGPKAVYPRVGGGTRPAADHRDWQRGLSPRGRGNRRRRPRRSGRHRSIPAWAGEPGSPDGRHASPGVYPRVGGGTGVGGYRHRRPGGLSPRGRGNRLRYLLPGRPDGSIPAWAGEPSTQSAGNPPSAVYPRVGGGTVYGRCLSAALSGLSPRGRGNPQVSVADDVGVGSIPAWAGEPGTGRRLRSPGGVYPRVGGGTLVSAIWRSNVSGLSPRGRGNPAAGACRGSGSRSIPAWAGEP